MPYHIDEENSELAFEVREGNKLVIKIKSNIFSNSLELYLIKVGDNTEPTDKNVFSSLRVLKEIENLHDTILKEINSVTSGFWELKQDSQGNEYISTKYNVLTEGGLTTYGLGEQKLGTIYDGLPIDNDTIYWEEVEGSRVLKAKGSGGGSTGLDETKLWNVLGTPGDQQVDYSHLRSAFSQFSNNFVTINTEQDITALKHFTAGLSVGESKKKIYEENGVVYIDADVAVTGAMTFYASAGRSVSTIMDGVVVDGTTIKKENGKLVAVGGGEAGSVAWGNITGKPSVFATNIANITDLHSSWDAVLKAQKPNWLTAVSIATISDLHANWDALLKAAPSAYVTRWPTISEVTGKQNLIVKLNGGTTEGTNQFTYNATGAKTINITPAGIGAYTKSESDSKYPTKTGSGASGTWAINITGTAGAAHSADSAVKLQNVRRLWGNNFDGTGDVTGQIVAYNGIYLPYGGKISDEYGNILRTNYDSASGYNDYFEITAIGTNKIGKSLRGGNSGLLTWDGNRFIFNSYGVGWYVEDGEWMRTYNNLFVPLKIQCNGNIECGSNITCRTLQANALDIAYGTNYKFVRMSWNGTSGDVASFFVPGSTSQWFTMELRSNGVLYINGDFLSGGGSTFYGSDIRYKSIIQQVKLSLLEIANAPSFIYRWNKHGMNQNRLNLGGSAQYAQKILPWAVNDNDNFLSMDYATVAYTFAVHTARHLLTYESRTDKKIKKLENRVKYLEKQLKKLGYEEVRTLDDSGI